jgi:hypothetical protein
LLETVENAKAIGDNATIGENDFVVKLLHDVDTLHAVKRDFQQTSNYFQAAKFLIEGRWHLKIISRANLLQTRTGLSQRAVCFLTQSVIFLIISPCPSI